MIRVLVVDDSSFIRRAVSSFLDGDPLIQVVGQAKDGIQALEKVAELKPDVITMDIEMPNMDGITAVKKIMETQPTPVLMLSSATRQGANATLDALHAGAADFMPKNFDEIAVERDEIAEKIRSRVRALGLRRKTDTKFTEKLKQTINAPSRAEAKDTKQTSCKVVGIGASTGGPVALENVLQKLPANFPLPILIVQHMPATFTQAFAERLNSLCKINVKQACDNDVIKPGTAYLAPGGKQMMIRKHGSSFLIKIDDADATVHYKPCVDITFKSLAKAYGNDVLGIIMTGMGADGCEGSRNLKTLGATIWAQDETTCVVPGMPMAVVNEKLADKIFSLEEIGIKLAKFA